MVKRAAVALVIVAMCTGCLGTFGLGGKVKKFNLSVVENRYAREGVYLGLTVLWVSRVCAVLDLFVFNSIEFWTGTNWVNGKSALVDLPVSAAEQMAFNDVERASIERLSDHEARLHLEFGNGDRVAFDVVREDRIYTVSYMGRLFYEGRIEPRPETTDLVSLRGASR